MCSGRAKVESWKMKWTPRVMGVKQHTGECSVKNAIPFVDNWNSLSCLLSRGTGGHGKLLQTH